MDSRGRDDSRHRSRRSRSLERPLSPYGHRSSHDNRSRNHASSPSRSKHSSEHRRRDRSRDSARHSSRVNDLIPRFRAKAEKEHEDRHRRHSRSRDRSSRRDPPSPGSSSKRRHGRSRSPESSHRKRSKKDHSPRRRDRSIDSDTKHRSSGERRHRSPRHRDREERPDDRRDSKTRSRRKSISLSRDESRDTHRRERDSLGSDSKSRRHRSRSVETRDSRRHADSSRRSYPDSRSSVDRDYDHRSSHRERLRSPRSHWDRGDRSVDDGRASRHDDGHREGHRREYPSDSSRTPLRPLDTQSAKADPRHRSPVKSPHTNNRTMRDPSDLSLPPRPPPTQHGSSRHGVDDSHQPPRGSSPPLGAPSGPMSQSHSGPPGGPRGTGFRRGSFSGRGGSGQSFTRDPRDSLPSKPSWGPSVDQDRTEHRDDAHDADDGGQDSNHHSSGRDTEMTTPSRAPPTGPAAQNSSGGKFSFAFKSSSKPPPAAPKLSIAEKFNTRPRSLPEKPTNDREPPRSAPTGPASSRPNESRNPLEGPRMAPRMRKVKKMMKRPKPRPVLEEHLRVSESVYYRKAGNESVIGSGTYGKVFKGLNVYTKGSVALKRIRMEGERDGFPVTAVREIKLLQSLRHINIVKLQEVMVEKNDCYMVFEYLSHDLTGLLNHPEFKLQPAQKKHLAKQLFEGLDYLHTRGVLHRDIKAANILVGSDGILKIADFGLARFYAKRHQLDYTNRVITIWYRSPELLLGETKYTAAVDIWSAACVLVEIFTKHAIFPGDGTELSQMDKIYNILGTPSRQDWPGLVDMAWFELLRPTAKRRNVFAEKYKDKVTPAAFDLLTSMFHYDPAKRPTATEALQHAYFTTEEPLPKQAVELADIGGDWHEFESKALRKENERKDREARRAAEKERKRTMEGGAPEAKRVHVEE